MNIFHPLHSFFMRKLQLSSCNTLNSSHEGSNSWQQPPDIPRLNPPAPLISFFEESFRLVKHFQFANELLDLTRLWETVLQKLSTLCRIQSIHNKEETFREVVWWLFKSTFNRTSTECSPNRNISLARRVFLL